MGFEPTTPPTTSRSKSGRSTNWAIEASLGPPFHKQSTISIKLYALPISLFVRKSVTGPCFVNGLFSMTLSYTAVKWLDRKQRNRDSSPTGQFTDTHFEDSSPTELKTVHRQNWRQFIDKFYVVFKWNVTSFTINWRYNERRPNIKLI